MLLLAHCIRACPSLIIDPSAVSDLATWTSRFESIPLTLRQHPFLWAEHDVPKAKNVVLLKSIICAERGRN